MRWTPIIISSLYSPPPTKKNRVQTLFYSPEETERDHDEDLDVRDPRQEGVVQRPVAGVHHSVLVHEVLGTSAQ